MSAVCPPLTVQLDAALDRLHRKRERLSREPGTVEVSLRLARLYQLEARLWSVLFERARVRLYWRAALAAEAHARDCARYWRDHARGGAA
ncbi:MAG: hypothetical protein ACRDTD_30635 [Pseudonocardiaceae bacterium]